MATKKKTPTKKKKATRAKRDVPILSRQKDWPLPWMGDFLDALYDLGSVWHAAQRAGVRRQRTYQARKECPEFAEAWEDVVESVTDDIEECAVYRARYGDLELHQGIVVKDVRKFDTTLQIFMLKTRRRKVYEQKLTLAGDPDAPLHSLSNDQVLQEVMAIMATAKKRKMADDPENRLSRN